MTASDPTLFHQLMDACDQAEQLRHGPETAWTVESLGAQVHDSFLTRGEPLPLVTCEEAARRVLTAATPPAPVCLDKEVTSPTPVVVPSSPAKPCVSLPSLSGSQLRHMGVLSLMMGGALSVMPILTGLVSDTGGSSSPMADNLAQAIQAMVSVGSWLGIGLFAVGGLLLMVGLAKGE
jgi:hypothetical protein